MSCGRLFSQRHAPLHIIPHPIHPTSHPIRARGSGSCRQVARSARRAPGLSGLCRESPGGAALSGGRCHPAPSPPWPLCSEFGSNPGGTGADDAGPVLGNALALSRRGRPAPPGRLGHGRDRPSAPTRAKAGHPLTALSWAGQQPPRKEQPGHPPLAGQPSGSVSRQRPRPRPVRAAGTA